MESRWNRTSYSASRKSYRIRVDSVTKLGNGDILMTSRTNYWLLKESIVSSEIVKCRVRVPPTRKNIAGNISTLVSGLSANRLDSLLTDYLNDIDHRVYAFAGENFSFVACRESDSEQFTLENTHCNLPVKKQIVRAIHDKIGGAEPGPRAAIWLPRFDDMPGGMWILFYARVYLVVDMYEETVSEPYSVSDTIRLPTSDRITAAMYDRNDKVIYVFCENDTFYTLDISECSQGQAPEQYLRGAALRLGGSTSRDFFGLHCACVNNTDRSQSDEHRHHLWVQGNTESNRYTMWPEENYTVTVDEVKLIAEKPGMKTELKNVTPGGETGFTSSLPEPIETNETQILPTTDSHLVKGSYEVAMTEESALRVLPRDVLLSTDALIDNAMTTAATTELKTTTASTTKLNSTTTISSTTTKPMAAVKAEKTVDMQIQPQAKSYFQKMVNDLAKRNGAVHEDLRKLSLNPTSELTTMSSIGAQLPPTTTVYMNITAKENRTNSTVANTAINDTRHRTIDENNLDDLKRTETQV
jgi:hypothetical protein